MPAYAGIEAETEFLCMNCDAVYQKVKKGVISQWGISQALQLSINILPHAVLCRINSIPSYMERKRMTRELCNQKVFGQTGKGAVYSKPKRSGCFYVRDDARIARSKAQERM